LLEEQNKREQEQPQTPMSERPKKTTMNPALDGYGDEASVRLPSLKSYQGLRRISKQELAKHDGSDNSLSVYVSVKGRVSAQANRRRNVCVFLSLSLSLP
jgi:hypothetical protein